jgi:NitT/TauT family transport system ATP-binding protein
MSGTPGRTRAVFDVDLPRPRELELTDTVEFAQLKRQVRESLERSL